MPTEGRRLGNNKLQRLILKGNGEIENGPEVATGVLSVWVGSACLQPPVCRFQRLVLVGAVPGSSVCCSKAFLQKLQGSLS